MPGKRTRGGNNRGGNGRGGKGRKKRDTGNCTTGRYIRYRNMTMRYTEIFRDAKMEYFTYIHFDIFLVFC